MMCLLATLALRPSKEPPFFGLFFLFPKRRNCSTCEAMLQAPHNDMEDFAYPTWLGICNSKWEDRTIRVYYHRTLICRGARPSRRYRPRIYIYIQYTPQHDQTGHTLFYHAWPRIAYQSQTRSVTLPVHRPDTIPRRRRRQPRASPRSEASRSDSHIFAPQRTCTRRTTRLVGALARDAGTTRSTPEAIANIPPPVEDSEDWL
jgi:hypothetical protein